MGAAPLHTTFLLGCIVLSLAITECHSFSLTRHHDRGIFWETRASGVTLELLQCVLTCKIDLFRLASPHARHICLVPLTKSSSRRTYVYAPFNFLPRLPASPCTYDNVLVIASGPTQSPTGSPPGPQAAGGGMYISCSSHYVPHMSPYVRMTLPAAATPGPAGSPPVAANGTVFVITSRWSNIV